MKHLLGSSKSASVTKSSVMLIRCWLLGTANPRLSPLEAYLFVIILDGGLYEGGRLVKLSETFHIEINAPSVINTFIRNHLISILLSFHIIKRAA